MEEKKNNSVFYSNRITITSSPYDIVLDFKFIIPVTPMDGGKPELIENDAVKIALSPHHFKAFLEIAQEQLKNYEKNFGELILKIPKQDQNAEK